MYLASSKIIDIKKKCLEERKLVDWGNVNCPHRKKLRELEKKIDKLYSTTASSLSIRAKKVLRARDGII